MSRGSSIFREPYIIDSRLLCGDVASFVAFGHYTLLVQAKCLPEQGRLFADIHKVRLAETLAMAECDLVRNSDFIVITYLMMFQETISHLYFQQSVLR